MMQLEATEWRPHVEPLRSTLLRTVTIAVVLGGILSFAFHGGLRRWPFAALLMLWPSVGGHWVDLWFLNLLRPRLPAARAAQIAARLVAWYVGGLLLALGMVLTAMAVARVQPSRWPAWWLGGFAFIVIELVAHLGLQVRARPSFYDGRG